MPVIALIVNNILQYSMIIDENTHQLKVLLMLDDKNWSLGIQGQK